MVLGKEVMEREHLILGKVLKQKTWSNETFLVGIPTRNEKPAPEKTYSTMQKNAQEIRRNNMFYELRPVSLCDVSYAYPL